MTQAEKESATPPAFDLLKGPGFRRARRSTLSSLNFGRLGGRCDRAGEVSSGMPRCRLGHPKIARSTTNVKPIPLRRKEAARLSRLARQPYLGPDLRRRNNVLAQLTHSSSWHRDFPRKRSRKRLGSVPNPKCVEYRCAAGPRDRTCAVRSVHGAGLHGTGLRQFDVRREDGGEHRALVVEGKTVDVTAR
jgi:hypothetical protein